MNKIIVLNWKDTQTLESAEKLLETVVAIGNIHADREWVVLPGDQLIGDLLNENNVCLGYQNFPPRNPLPYCLVGHMSRRKGGERDDEIESQLVFLTTTETEPILCVGPVEETGTLEMVMRDQLSVIGVWPKDKPLCVAYEPGFAIGNGRTLALEDIEIVHQILRKALEGYNARILYGGSVNDENIGKILGITDGVIIGTASKTITSLLALSIALGQM